MSTAPFQIGEQVYFRQRGTTLEGRIVGSETITNPHIGQLGQNFYVQHDNEVKRIHASTVTGVVPQLADAPIWT